MQVVVFEPRLELYVWVPVAIRAVGYVAPLQADAALVDNRAVSLFALAAAMPCATAVASAKQAASADF